MKRDVATIPLLLHGEAFLVTGVPAEICQNCREPFMTGEVVDSLTALLSPLHRANTEVSVLTYEPAVPATALVAEARTEYRTQPKDDAPSGEAEF